ncbi:RagB/SusD family nutrient uptake outer membrane protein [Pleomorphovibrio marinus]|uniref:RagB/SusD family nutrient uptake outer membrane protein n=1 Tax=Pleomorphovibrio marinus TaxID=2164132 RepID=UPI0018E5964B|nr:RagB/SusD family nutrient uptake outer membrane protein [Pleomorphovibrio marinus]
MKKIISINIIASMFIFQSCMDIFEREPLDKISETVVWTQEPLIEAYVLDLYARFPFFAYPGMTLTDLATERFTNMNAITMGTMTQNTEMLGYWDYVTIRDCNVFLERIREAPIDELAKERLEGEVRAIRAVIYFEKQKRYGGVPLVDTVLDPFEDLDPAYLRRSTEERIADFINEELDLAIQMLGENVSRTGRINKWSAYAYKSRANLWAASIAKYGAVQREGLVGIPEARANEFFQKAADAANAVIQSGTYNMYNVHADRSENYRYLFLDDSNSEIIFERLYDGPIIGHSFSHNNYPTRFSAGQGSITNPLLELLYSYENIDGTTDQPDFGPAHLYEDGIAPWSNKDPRLRATVFLQGEPYGGDMIRTYEGLDPSPEPNPGAIISDFNVQHQGTPTVGPDSRLSQQNFRTTSGFLLRKYIIDEPLVERDIMTTSWKAIRLGEMYLNLAEAAYELGDLETAVGALNVTRERAGISLLDAGDLTLDRLRNERKVELAFEGFRYWDLRRWRTARQVLNRDDPFRGLRIILHHASGQFYFIPFEAETFTRIFREEHYYNPFLLSRLENNTHLLQNPGY